MKRWLVDTGPLVAYLDRADSRHGDVAECIDGFSGQLTTTGAVVTEVMYVVSDAPEGPLSFAELLVRARVQIVDVLQPSRIAEAAALMKKYADTPMDFADATLVGVAEQLGILDVLTLDRRGFSTYRTSRGRGFRLVLAR
jgi:predicted nucleic acid-binding protein